MKVHAFRATSRIELTNRESPPDAILGEVRTRTGDQPCRVIDDEWRPSQGGINVLLDSNSAAAS